jgi:CheY-like chemotaxis protein
MIQQLGRTMPALSLQPRTPSVGWAQVVRSQDDGRSGANIPLSRGRILIVEDEYFISLDAEDALSSAGYTVVGIATTAAEAVEMAEAERPDMVLMDIRLDGSRDGIDAAAEILSRLGIPSLFATAHADAGTRARGDNAASPLGWLSKPYTHEEVAAAVAAAVSEARRRALPSC